MRHEKDSVVPFGRRSDGGRSRVDGSGRRTRNLFIQVLRHGRADVCSFPITVDFSSVGTETDFVDSSGAITMAFLHFVEQDTFSANGKTLTGEPYTANVHFLLDSSGNITHIFGQGIVEKVVLPDGGLFITAGRVDFVAHGSPPFLITPDVGAAVNLAGFCAALSP